MCLLCSNLNDKFLKLGEGEKQTSIDDSLKGDSHLHNGISDSNSYQLKIERDRLEKKCSG